MPIIQFSPGSPGKERTVMFKYLTQKWKQKRGFTLMEVMVVVAILAVIAGIAIPSVINMRKNMKFTERNDYAKAIFMAAQANLTEMRSKGELDLLQAQATTDNRPAKTYGAPDGYFYTDSSMQNSYALVLPVNSVDSTVRNEQVIIEYNPKAGIVYSVFYYEGSSGELHSMYTTANKIDRSNEEARKELLVGYYSVGSIDALDAQALDVRQTSSTLSYTNATQSVAVVRIPIKDSKGFIMFENPDSATYIKGLEVTLSVVGEHGGSFTTSITGKDNVFNFSYDNPNSEVLATFYLDSLTAISNTNNAAYSFTDISQINAGESKIIPGDNITITAEVTYIPSAKDPIVMIESSTIAGVNPLYHSLTQNPDTAEGVKPYILAISNARHLQNLQYLDGAFADENIESIVFVAQTEEDAVTNSGGSNTEDPSTPSSDPAEPSDGAEKARTAGTPNGNEASDSPSTSAENTDITIDWAGNGTFKPITFSTDYEHPKIIGNGVEIRNLNIEKASADNDGFSIGLFSKLKGASISGITLVDPTVTNNTVFLSGSAISSAATTGALIGSAESVTIEDCNIVIKTGSAGISGKQLVGGLVGHVKGTSSFKNCSVGNIPVVDMGKTAGQDDKITYQLGGLVGYAEGTAGSVITFDGCDTTATVTATTATDLGGMAGKAVNASFTGCSTEATVTGADGVLSNIGGLVGYAEDTLFTNPDSNAVVKPTVASGMNVFSSDNTKNHVGGMVGYAKGSAKDKTKFTNYSVSERATVLSNVNTCSDIGGMVGYADTVTFSNCNSNASVNGSQKVNSEGTPISDIPNNNLGGFIGYSKNSTFNNIDVTLNYLPTYAMDAGVFAGYVSGSEINDLELYLSPKATDATTHTVHRFGVVSSTLDQSPLAKAKIEINGNIINANCFGGAAFITDQSPITNVSVEMKSGRMIGNQTAGFVGVNGSGSDITNCSVLADVTYTSDHNGGTSNEKVTPGVAGFVLENSANIRTSIANVTLPGGSAFAAANNGTIKDCYGWAWNSSSGSDIDLEISKNCSYSYFVNGSTDEMVMYEGLTDSASTKSTNILDTDALTDPWALELLNTNETDATKCAWEKSNTSYPYPKLKGMSHVGDHKAPVIGDYPYVLKYIENGTEYVTMEYEANGTLKDVSGDLGTPPSSDSNIEYYLYHRTDDAFTSYGTALSRTDNEALYKDVPRLYTIYKLVNNESFTIDGISFNTRYPLYDETGTYRIRTAQQFKNLNNVSSGTYCVEVNLNLKDITLDSFGGTLKAINNATITASKSLVNNLTGRLSGLTVTGLTEPMVGTIEGGTVTGCDVSGEIESGENVGIIAGTMSSGSIDKCNVSGSVSGSGYVGSVIGKVTGGSVSDVDSSATVSGDVSKAGMFVGYAENCTFTNCTSTATTDKLPFGHFEEKELENVTHKSTLDVKEKVLVGNLDSYTELEEGTTIKTVDVTLTNCKFNGNQPALEESEHHYYTIDKGSYVFESGTELTMSLRTADEEQLRYSTLKNLVDDASTSPVATKCYASLNNTYYRVYVSVKAVEPQESNESDKNTESKTEYTFTLTANASTIFEKTITEDKLSEKVTADSNAPNFYQLGDHYESTAHKKSGGYFLINGHDSYKYLTYNLDRGIIEWGGSESSINSLWYGDGNGGWRNYVNDDAVVTITELALQNDSFPGVVSVKFENQEHDADYCKTFSTTYIALYYPCKALGHAYTVNYPNATSSANES